MKNDSIPLPSKRWVRQDLGVRNPPCAGIESFSSFARPGGNPWGVFGRLSSKLIVQLAWPVFSGTRPDPPSRATLGEQRPMEPRYYGGHLPGYSPMSGAMFTGHGHVG